MTTGANIVYTKNFCGYCRMVKRLLDEKGVRYEERLIEDIDELEALKERRQFRTFPMVILNGRFIGGCQETIQAFQSGAAQAILTGPPGEDE